MELEFKDDDVDAFGDNDLDDKGEENEGLEPPSSPTSLSQASPQEAQDKGQQREHGGGQEEEQGNAAKGTQDEERDYGEELKAIEAEEERLRGFTNLEVLNVSKAAFTKRQKELQH